MLVNKNLTMSGGLLRRAESILTSEEVYDFFKNITHYGGLSPEILNFKISKKPAQITFTIDVTDKIIVEAFFKNIVLSEEQAHNAAFHGYFNDGKYIRFVDPDSKLHLQKIKSKIKPSELILLVRELKLSNKLNNAPEDLMANLMAASEVHNVRPSLFQQELYPYQKAGLDWLSFCSRNAIGTILGDDMGLGKTAQVIALICDVIEREPDSKIIIVVPNPLLENWRREFLFFAPSLKPFIHYGPRRSGLATDIEEHQIIITPLTTLTNDITMFVDIDFCLALFDEASMLKNPESARTIAANSLNATVKIAMTGTPVENSLVDVWALSNLVFQGYQGSLKEFKSRYVDNNIEITLNKNLEELEESLKQITLRRMKKDVLKELPKKRDVHIAVSMTESERIAYDKIITEMKLEADAGVRNVLPMINKLQQFTSHPALLDDSLGQSLNELMAASSKFDLLIHRLDKIKSAGEKVLIFATFTKAIDLIEHAIKTRYSLDVGVIDGRTPNVDRQPLIDQFSGSTGFDVLILHPRTAGMGLNITAATNVIHYSRQWNPALEQQATARAWRNGQKLPVSVYYYYYADTIEETVDQRLRLKQDLSDRVVTVTDDKESDKELLLNYLNGYKS
jgi:SNF2 family DNA or RNA helicase